MALLIPAWRSACLLLLLLSLQLLPALRPGEVHAAAMPRMQVAPDSTILGQSSNSVLGIDSDSNADIRFRIALQTIVVHQLLQIVLVASNTLTTSGGPYPIVGVYFTLILSHHLRFVRCLDALLTCTVEPDPQTGGSNVRVDMGSMPANQTKEIDIEIEAVEAGNAVIQGTLHQTDFDPNPANNNASLNFTISQPQPGAVRGFKFEDVNGNGSWEQDEPGLNDWTIRLVDEENELTTLTETKDGLGDGIIAPLEEGWFVFESVNPGGYQLHEDLKEGWVQSAPGDAYYEITVQEGQTAGDYDFGNFRPGQIQGSVFHDADSNGQFGAGESSLAGREVHLNGTTGMGEAVSRSTVTDGNGIYGFSDLHPGSYTVTATAPGHLPAPTALPATIALTSGMTVEAADFGFTEAPAPRLEVTIVPSSVQTLIGALVPFTVTATNTGTATAHAVTVGLGWPGGLYRDEFIGLPQNCEDDDGFLYLATICPVGDLAPSASAALTFHLRILASSRPSRSSLGSVSGGAEADNHPFVSANASVTAEKLDIDLGAFKARAGGNRKTAEGEVDVYLDSVLVAPSLAEGAAAAYAAKELTHTHPMLHVLPAGEENLEHALYVEELAFGEGPGENYVLPASYFLVLTDNDAILIRDSDTSSPDGETVSFAVVHAAPGLGAVDVFHEMLGATPLDAGSATGYSHVAPGVHVVEVRQPASTVVMGRYAFDWTSSGGEAYVVVLSDGPAGGIAQAIGSDGEVVEATLGTAVDEPGLPTRITLYASYPNPFNPVTTISYALPAAGEVRLEVFDALGRQVALLAEGVQEAGRHDVAFRAEGLPSGMYVYRLTASSYVEARTVVLLK